ncbi:metal ABC transporter ATP-binding protein [Deinococcus deserti]|uniref:Putative Mn/Zn ABC transporter, ATP-binding component n=1 Tax=Deinococcus deserti (strain DSM 17065 / CIP 109153 / LMG 22923 / VCD115) TaxID=546414 RepID=C1D313_DEIDV|nr:metal ABC transporter ATP-binding protein [Deinococcus deserti]ACO47802.1 putative Mn/Zn ABC transporter, ATP-binding component [Deinococcus deserti VCD115]
MTAGPVPAPLTVRDLTVAYHEQPVLWDVDVTFPAGRLCAIVGPNGAGKSTLLKASLGLLPVASGTVRFFGEPLAQVRHRVAYVPQRTSVDWDFPTDALDVVSMGLYGRVGWFRRLRRAERQLAMDALERVHLADLAGRQISQLSGGQQQRVFLARALAQDAEVYLMDEPFAGVDATTERAILDVMQDLQRAGRTVIVVHHDLDTVRDYFDHLTLLNVEVVANGALNEVFQPELLQRAYGARTRFLRDLLATGGA